MKTEVIAGVTTFLTMAYILIVQPLALQNAGIVVNNDATLVSLGNFGTPAVMVAVLGLALAGVLVALHVKGALLLGILGATVIGIPLSVTSVAEGFTLVSVSPSPAPVAFQVEWTQIFTVDMLIVVVTFLFVDMFDTVGTLVGVATKAGLIDKEGRISRVKQALLADAVGTTVGAMLGTSTVTTRSESASGVEEGGRTRPTALVEAILFFVALFSSRLFLLIPAAATSPALTYIVGVFFLISLFVSRRPHRDDAPTAAGPPRQRRGPARAG